MSEDTDTDLIAALRRRVSELEDQIDRERRASSFWFAAWRDAILRRSPLSKPGGM